MEHVNKKKYDVEYLDEVARIRGGKCLSVEYKNLQAKLQWECAQGHFFTLSLGKILYRNSWCPTCNIKISQEICRVIFEYIFQEKFTKYRAEWLRSSYGGVMELDGYCENLKMAFEYQGPQHYKQSSYFHKKVNSFANAQQRDKEKRIIAIEKGIHLVEIPYFPANMKLFGIVDYVVEILELNGMQVPLFDKDKINFQKIFSVNKREEINKLVISKGGTLLSEVYLNETIKIVVKCKAQHQWQVTPYHLRSGEWCSKCAYIEMTNQLVGKRFGRLVVVERDKNKKDIGRNAHWRCLCDCGNEVTVLGPSLRRGATKSCGCLLEAYYSNRKFIDLVGERFGRLVVIERTREKKDKSGNVYFKCVCDCSNEVIVNSRSLRSRKTDFCEVCRKKYLKK